MADVFYHVSQLLFFVLSAALLYWLLRQNNEQMAQARQSLQDPVRPPANKRPRRR